ncbi:hypothetical protein ABI59_02880 [Acidobacteria bacterium Mor1]|nr:hypothetical protein ABI59_02880 [Acidobacteria bacterium Mor1]
MTDWKSSLRADPTPWLLEVGCPAIRYRTLTELLERGKDDPDVQAAHKDLLEYGPAVKLQKSQKKDGSWGTAIHASDPKKLQTCTENALMQLYEMGWNRDTKTVRAAAKLLRSYVSGKKDVKFYEFAKVVKADDRRQDFYRWFLRILCLNLLLRAGYLDERSRGALLDLLELTAGFVENPISRDPVEEIGASHPMIRMAGWRQGYAFIPDVYILQTFASSPWLLDGELAKIRLKKIFDYVLSPTYQALAPDIGLVRTSKGSFVKGHGLKLRTVEEYQKQGNVDELLVNLELMARLGLVNRYPLLMSHMDWVVSQQTKDGRWSLSTKLWSDTSRWAQLLRLEKDWRSPARKEADMTFRVLLILKHQWERQMRMLDRRDDGYPI